MPDIIPRGVIARGLDVSKITVSGMVPNCVVSLSLSG